MLYDLFPVMLCIRLMNVSLYGHYDNKSYKYLNGLFYGCYAKVFFKS